MKYYLIRERVNGNNMLSQRRTTTIWKAKQKSSPSRLTFHCMVQTDDPQYRPASKIALSDIQALVIKESDNVDELIEYATFEAL